MKTAKHIVGIFAAVSGIIANISGLYVDSHSNLGNVYFNEVGAGRVTLAWFTALSIALWVVFLILLVIPAKKPSAKAKK